MKTSPDLERPDAIAPATSPRRRVQLPDAIAGAIIAAQAVALGLAVRGGNYLLDDVYNYVLGWREPMSFGYLGGRLFNHWFPGFRFANWLLPRLAPVNYGATAAASVVMMVLSGLLLWSALRRLFGAGPGSLALLVVYSLNILWIRPVQWWSATLNVVIGNLLVTFAVWAYVRYALDKRKLAAVGAFAGLGLGLMFYEKPVIAVPLLALIGAAMRGSWRGILAALRRERWFWLSVVALTGLYVFNMVVLAPPKQTATAPTAMDLVQLAGRAWGIAMGPAMFFGGWTLKPDFGTAPLSTIWTPVGAALLTGALTLVLVAVSLWRAVRRQRADAGSGRRNPSPLLQTVIGWGIAFGAVSVGIGVAGMARFTSYGFVIVRNPQYLADSVLFVVVGLGFALIGHRGDASDAVLVDVPGPTRTRLPARTAWAAWAAFTVFAVVHATITIGWGAWSGPRWHKYGSSAYFDRVFAALDAAKTGGHPLVLFDGPMPQNLVIAGWSPFQTLSEVMPIFRHDVRFQDPAAGGLVVTTAGDVVPARLQVTDRGVVPAANTCPSTTGASMLATAAASSTPPSIVPVRLQSVAAVPPTTGQDPPLLQLHVVIRSQGVARFGVVALGNGTPVPVTPLGTPTDLRQNGEETSVTLMLTTVDANLGLVPGGPDGKPATGSWCVVEVSRGQAVPTGG